MVEAIKTPLARMAFTQNLLSPGKNDKGEDVWGCTLIIPKTVDISALKNAAGAAAIEKFSDKAAQMIKDGVLKTPILDGDGPQAVNGKTGQRYEGFAGCWFIRPSSREPIPVVDAQRIPITDPRKAYSGAYAYAIVAPYGWYHEKSGKRGVSFGLRAIQVAKDGEPLGREPVDPDKYFDKIADEGAPPPSTTSGAGAAGLFA